MQPHTAITVHVPTLKLRTDFVAGALCRDVKLILGGLHFLLFKCPCTAPWLSRRQPQQCHMQKLGGTAASCSLLASPTQVPSVRSFAAQPPPLLGTRSQMQGAVVSSTSFYLPLLPLSQVAGVGKKKLLLAGNWDQGGSSWGSKAKPLLTPHMGVPGMHSRWGLCLTTPSSPHLDTGSPAERNAASLLSAFHTGVPEVRGGKGVDLLLLLLWSLKPAAEQRSSCSVQGGLWEEWGAAKHSF